MDREVVALGVGRDALRDGPGDQHAVALEPQVPVQPAGVVLVHHEARLLRRVGALAGPRLGRRAEVALGAVGVQAVVTTQTLRASTRLSTLPTAMDANPIVLDESADDVVVVVVEGEHDIYTAPTLRERLEEALERRGGVVVDLTAATFVDSSVLGALLDARRRALDADQGYVVCVGDQVEPGVQRILDITGLVPVLPVVGDRASAIDYARAGVRG